MEPKRMYLTDIAEEIKQRIDMRDICEKYGIEVSRSGFCRCISPHHLDNNPSMKVYHDGAKCFSCGAHAASVIDFEMILFDISFREACKRLNDDFNLGLLVNDELTPEERKRAAQAKRERAENRELIKKRHKVLQNHVYDAMVRCSALQNIIDETPPSSDPFEDLDDRYLTALSQLPAAEYALRVAEINLSEFEHQYKVG